MRKLILFLAAVSLVLFAEKALCYETTFSIEPESFNSFRYHEMRVEEAAPLSIRTGRFLSVDPGKDWDPRVPQSWNAYAYGRNNPVNGTDPDGRVWGWLVNLGRKGLRKVQKIELDDAVRNMQEGEDIYGASQQKARHAARKAGKGDPVLDPAHGPTEEGFEPHYHAVDENGVRIKGYGHAFFKGAVGFAFSLIPGMDAEATGMATANPILERRAQEMFGRSYFELDADERRAIFESFREPEEERQRRRDDVPAEPQQ